MLPGLLKAGGSCCAMLFVCDVFLLWFLINLFCSLLLLTLKCVIVKFWWHMLTWI